MGLDNKQVSFEDPRCPGMTMFEVNAEIGISHSEFSMPLNVVDDMKIAQPDPQFHSTERNFTDRLESLNIEQRFQNTTFLLNLAVRYDKLFSGRFPGTEVARYNYDT